MNCPRCGLAADPTRTFCPDCGALVERGRLDVYVSTDDTRGRALDELDRTVGLYDSDAVVEAKEREYQA
jgi:uncharacterized OB-fold protein